MAMQVKQETVKLLGKGDMYYNPPEHPPVTEPGRKALEAAHDYRKTLSGEAFVIRLMIVTPRHPLVCQVSTVLASFSKL